jgi:SLOG family YspA-like protein
LTDGIVVLVCGGRDYTNRARIRSCLDELHGVFTIGMVVHGAARGADTEGALWAAERGIGCVAYRADWDKYGPSAGPIRNQQMLDEGKPDLVVAFPGGNGTADMARRAEAAGIKVVRIQDR